MGYCTKCGTNKGERTTCPTCGGAAPAPTRPPATATPTPVSYQQPSPPAPPFPQYGGPQSNTYTQNVYVQNPGTNGMAIASFICSFLCSILGIIFGHVALSQINKSGEGGRGLAIAGLILGYLGLIFWLLWILAIGAASAA